MEVPTILQPPAVSFISQSVPAIDTIGVLSKTHPARPKAGIYWLRSTRNANQAPV